MRVSGPCGKLRKKEGCHKERMGSKFNDSCVPVTVLARNTQVVSNDIFAIAFIIIYPNHVSAGVAKNS